MKDMTFEQLEAVANDESIKTPRDLKDSIETALAAAEISRIKRRKITMYAVPATLTAALAGLALILAIPSQPKDTYDDPELAYAEIEKAFTYMSGKVEKGMEIASEATPIIERTTEVFSK